ncbi:corticotropin-releasing factor receptor 2, partial [Biomphalaria pfeifferi]
SIQCNRISIHKHLVMAFIINFSIMVYQTQPNYSNYRQLEWLCKTVLALSKCSQMATFSWMLVEGIYLHNRLVVTVFPSAAPFRIFYFIGWGLPIVFTLIWSTLMYLNDKSLCWDGYTQTNLIFIIFVPIMLALLLETLNRNSNSVDLIAVDLNTVDLNAADLNAADLNAVDLNAADLNAADLNAADLNPADLNATVLSELFVCINSAFLVNIIRVLVTKLRNNNLMESRRIRKAIKATVVLLPLLGTANLVFFSQPRDVTLMTIARVVNSVLPACQVRNAIKKKWRRCLTNRALNTRTRRQGSRTSSYFLSQSEVPARRTQNLRSTVVRERDYHSMSVLTAAPVLSASSHQFDLKKVSL